MTSTRESNKKKTEKNKNTQENIMLINANRNEN